MEQIEVVNNPLDTSFLSRRCNNSPECLTTSRRYRKSIRLLMRGFTELPGSSEGTSTHNLYHSKMEKVLPSESLLDIVKSHNHAKYVNKKEPPHMRSQKECIKKVCLELIQDTCNSKVCNIFQWLCSAFFCIHWNSKFPLVSVMKYPLLTNSFQFWIQRTND